MSNKLFYFEDDWAQTYQLTSLIADVTKTLIHPFLEIESMDVFSADSNVLIVFALEIESQKRFENMNVLHCGIGKVNAAYRLTAGLANWKQQRGGAPKIVVNLGSAGSNYFDRKTIVNATQFIQRDFDASALGFPLYVTPLESMPMTLTNGMRYGDFPEGACGTGDSFVTDGATRPWNLVDMEAYALAKVCAFETISFGCLKYITDGADGHAATSWEAGLPATASALREAIEALPGLTSPI